MSQFASRPAETFAFQDIRYEKAGGIATVTINRPQHYNAYSTRALEELARAFRDASFDDAVGVIVMTGAGTFAFCTGGDVKEYAADYVTTPRDYWKYMALFRAYIESILNTGKPVIARLNGMAVGGGNESQLACDLTVMAQHGFIRQVGTQVGSVACGGSTQWLPITVGDKRAREMLFLNEPVPALKALDWGLVNRVVPSVRQGDRWIDEATPAEIKKAQSQTDGYAIDLSRLDAEVGRMAAKILDTFPECARYTKQQVNFWKDLAWHQTVRHAQDWLALHYTSWEPVEGMRAFVEKRPARYSLLRERAAEGRSSETPWGPPTSVCEACGANNLPAEHAFCGACGIPLSHPVQAAV